MNQNIHRPMKKRMRNPVQPTNKTLCSNITRALTKRGVNQCEMHPQKYVIELTENQDPPIIIKKVKVSMTYLTNSQGLQTLDPPIREVPLMVASTDFTLNQWEKDTVPRANLMLPCTDEVSRRTIGKWATWLHLRIEWADYLESITGNPART